MALSSTPLFAWSSDRQADTALVKPSEVDTLVSILRGNGWTSAKAIALKTGWKDRRIRKIASESEGQILSGQEGYKLTRECTPDEAQHASNWLKSQGREMIRRSIRIQGVFHKQHHERLQPAP